MLTRKREISPLLCVSTGSGVHPAPFSIDTTFFPGVKWLELESDHTLPSSEEDSNEGNYASTPPRSLRVIDRENFTFYLL
jgi:hypothetical protein